MSATFHSEPISLRDSHLPPVLPEDPKLGRELGANHKPTAMLADYIHEDAEAPPAAVTRPHPGFQWGMLANDTLGDCVIAMMLHTIEDFFLDAGYPPPAFSPADAIAMYSAITGYVPGDESTDQGTNEESAMEYWKTKGLVCKENSSTHTIVGSLGIDPKDHELMRRGIAEFVDVQLGVALPLSAQGQQEWAEPTGGFGEGNEPGSWGGHGIPTREYDATDFKVVTWGEELLMTVEFSDGCVEQAFVVVTKEMLNKSGVGPSGVNWTKLTEDFAELSKA
jgi:hypothetical protein